MSTKTESTRAQAQIFMKETAKDINLASKKSKSIMQLRNKRQFTKNSIEIGKLDPVILSL